MLGYIIYGDGPKRPELGERRLLGVPFLTLSMGQPPRPHGPLARRRALLAARQMRARCFRWTFPIPPSSWARGSALWIPFPCGGPWRRL